MINQQENTQKQRDIPLRQSRPTVKVFAVKSKQIGFQQMGIGILQIVTDAYQNRSQHYIQVYDLKDHQSIILRSHLNFTNNFQIQKDSVICWQDDALSMYDDLAISFETQLQCDIYWRLICSKIGKNYLEVQGNQTLDMPNQINLTYIMNKVKSSFKLVAYHIVNSNQFLDSLEKVFNNLKKKKDEAGLGMICKIFKAILNSLDVKVLDALLSDRHFAFFLKVQKYQIGINFAKIYQNKTRMRMIFIFPRQISQKINMVHRALFVKQNILDLAQQARLENLLKIIIQDNYFDIISYLISADVLKIVSDLKVEQFVNQVLQIHPQLYKQYQRKFLNRFACLNLEENLKDDKQENQNQTQTQSQSQNGKDENTQRNQNSFEDKEHINRIEKSKSNINISEKEDFNLNFLIQQKTSEHQNLNQNKIEKNKSEKTNKKSSLNKIASNTNIQISRSPRISNQIQARKSSQEIQQQSLLQKWSLRRIHSTELNTKIRGHEQQIMKQWKIDFIVQSFGIVNQINGQKTKTNYFNQFYQKGIIKIYSKLLDENFSKTVQIFTQIARFNPLRFLQYLRDQFREQPNHNLNTNLAKKYSFNGQDFQIQIRNFLEIVLPTIQQRKDFMDFYTGTFIVFIFDHCTKAKPILQLLNLFSLTIPYSTSLNSLIIKHKVLEKISTKIGNNMNKKQYLLCVKLIRSYLIIDYDDSNQKKKEQLLTLQSEIAKNFRIYMNQKNPKNQKKQKIFVNLSQTQLKQINKIRKGFIDSFLLDRCLIFFRKIYKNNSLISSAMLETLKLVTKIPYNVITHHIKQNYQYWDISKYFGQIGKMEKPSNNRSNNLTLMFLNSDQQDSKNNSNNESFLQMNRNQIEHRNILEREQEQKYLNDGNLNQQREINIYESNESKIKIKIKIKMDIQGLQQEQQQQEKFKRKHQKDQLQEMMNQIRKKAKRQQQQEDQQGTDKRNLYWGQNHLSKRVKSNQNQINHEQMRNSKTNQDFQGLIITFGPSDQNQKDDT